MGKTKFHVCAFDRGRMHPVDFENHVNGVLKQKGDRVIRVEPCTSEGTAVVVIEYEADARSSAETEH